MDGHCLVLITCGETTESGEMARHLVESRLAGVQIVRLTASTGGEGEIVEDHEVAELGPRTRRDLFQDIESVVNEMHPTRCHRS